MSSWTDVECAKKLRLIENETVGFLLDEDADRIVLATTFSRATDTDDRGRVENVEVIAKKLITETKELTFLFPEMLVNGKIKVGRALPESPGSKNST